MKLRSAALRPFLAPIVAAAGLAIFAVVSQRFAGLGERMHVTSLLVGGFSLTSLAFDRAIDRGRVEPLMLAGVARSIAAQGV